MVQHLQQRFHDFGPFRVDAGRRLLLRRGDQVPLTPKAFDILLVLLQNRDRVVEKDELMKLVWPNTVVEENNLTRNISSLRKALEEDPNEHRFIVTIPGRGYQFAADMLEDKAATGVVYERHARARVLIEEQSEENSTAQPIQPSKTEIAKRKFWRSIAFRVTVAVAICTLLALGASLYVSRRGEAILPALRVVPLPRCRIGPNAPIYRRTGIFWLSQGTLIRRIFLGSISSRSAVTIICRLRGAVATVVLLGRQTGASLRSRATGSRSSRSS